MAFLKLRRSRVGVGAGAAVAAFLAIVAAAAVRHPEHSSADANVRAMIAQDADSLDGALAALDVELRTTARDSFASSRVHHALRVARARFKRVEGVTEFFSPALASAFNSRRQEVDDDDAPPPSTLAPTGFPALEAVLYPTVTDADSARRIVATMRPLANRLRTLAPALIPTGAQVIEISRLELARVSTLGIAGFDAPRSGEAMRESADALDGLRALSRMAGPGFWPLLGSERDRFDTALARASAYLRANADFESFNRLAFITSYAQPAAVALDSLRRAAGTTPVRIPRAWRVAAPSVYSPNAFDARAYAPSGTPLATAALVSLGARLFVEPRVSGNGKRSCASCHNPARKFADGLRTAESIGPRGSRVERNTPTLINAALQPAQFADERSVTVEDQVVEVLRSPTEMASSVERVTKILRTDSVYSALFAATFAEEARTAVTPLHVRQALAAYVRSLATLDSRFDQAVRGDTNALTSEERRGFTLFMGKAACGTCHFAPLFSGNTPPLYMSSDVEVIGTSASSSRFAMLDADSGRARIDHLATHMRAFKTPSLRNVSRTAPYMHNGAFRTLDEVLRFYDAGGGKGAGARIENQTLAADSLHLTAGDRKAIIAFLGALSDRAR